MDMGIYWAIVAALYPPLIGYFLGQFIAWVAQWWQERKYPQRLKEAAEHLTKE